MSQSGSASLQCGKVCRVASSESVTSALGASPLCTTRSLAVSHLFGAVSTDAVHLAAPAATEYQPWIVARLRFDGCSGMTVVGARDAFVAVAASSLFPILLLLFRSSLLGVTNFVEVPSPQWEACTGRALPCRRVRVGGVASWRGVSTQWESTALFCGMKHVQ